MSERSWSPGRIAAMVAGGIALALVLAFVFGYFVMILWNWLMPVIFGLPRISYWQGWGLILISHILLKPGFHDHGHAGPEKHFHREAWKKRMRDKFGKKAPEAETDIPGEAEPVS